MKNIHLIETDKPSRLGYLTKKGKEVFKDLRLFDRLMPNILDSENQNIYITNSEEIKIGDYYLDFRSDGIKLEHFKTKNDWVFVGICDSKKVILTTDPELIKDGIQPISGDFLEWFIDNQSCEYVEVQKVEHITNMPYRVVLPKEEPKQETFNLKKGLKEIQLQDPNTCERYKEVGCIKDICTCYTLVPKQETIE